MQHIVTKLKIEYTCKHKKEFGRIFPVIQTLNINTINVLVDHHSDTFV